MSAADDLAGLGIEPLNFGACVGAADWRGGEFVPVNPVPGRPIARVRGQTPKTTKP